MNKNTKIQEPDLKLLLEKNREPVSKGRGVDSVHIVVHMLVRRRLKDCLNLKEEIDQLDEQGSEKTETEKYFQKE